MASDRLNDYERGVLLPLVVGFLQSSGTRVVPGDALAAAVRKQGHVCDRRQIRLIVNHIRTNAIIPCLASNNKGYFVAQERRSVVLGKLNSSVSAMARKARQLADATIHELRTVKPDSDGKAN